MAISIFIEVLLSSPLEWNVLTD